MASDWELFLDLIFRKTSAILIVLRALPNSGADGIFHLAHGSGIIFYIPLGGSHVKPVRWIFNSFSCVDGNRILAWGGMEFYPVGTDVCGAFTD